MLFIACCGASVKALPTDSASLFFPDSRLGKEKKPTKKPAGKAAGRAFR
jgi:hypothetical protein